MQFVQPWTIELGSHGKAIGVTMTTDPLAAFNTALTAYLQPIMNNFMDLQTWAQISAGGEWGVCDDVLDRLNKNLDGLRANHATAYEMSCPEDAWIPTCRISMILSIKDVEILFGVTLIRSEIVALDFPEDDFLEDLQGVDLAYEFKKLLTFASLSRVRLSP
jgi:hypothetical protein